MGKKKTKQPNALKNDKVQAAVSVWHPQKDDKAIHRDVLGSYTGTPQAGETPVQDGDDL